MKKLTTTLFLILLITLITFGNALWYFYGWQLFRSHQSYLIRELLSTSHKIITYVLPTIVLFRPYRKQSWHISWHRVRWQFSIVFVIILISAKYLISSVDIHPHITLLTYGYVLIVNSIIEERVFRWILLKQYTQKFSFLTANILQACCFWLVHLPFYVRMGKSWISLLIGLWWVTLLWIRRWYVQKQTNSLFYPAVLHSVWNGILLFG